MEIEKHLAELAQADPQARRTALENVLAAEGLTPEIQECEADERRKAARNYLLYTADKDAKGPLFCAHYDAHPGSTGANDNAAAVCILIALAKELQQRKIPATIAFFDGEESGHSGAKLFEDGRKREVSCVVNLDMCGYGDTIAVYARGRRTRGCSLWGVAGEPADPSQTLLCWMHTIYSLSTNISAKNPTCNPFGKTLCKSMIFTEKIW